MAMPICTAMEMDGMQSDNAVCTIPSCGDLDSDDEGTPLGTVEWSIPLRRPELDPNCMAGNALCNAVQLGFQRGGNKCHNACADAAPAPNQYLGSDTTICGVSFDNSQAATTTSVIAVNEIKTSAYRTSRRTNQLVCAFIKKKILLNVLASINKELPVANACQYTYQVATADTFLADDVNTILMAPDMPIDLYQNSTSSDLVTLNSLMMQLNIDSATQSLIRAWGANGTGVVGAPGCYQLSQCT
jgi:hypothetical protein